MKGRRAERFISFVFDTLVDYSIVSKSPQNTTTVGTSLYLTHYDLKHSVVQGRQFQHFTLTL